MRLITFANKFGYSLDYLFGISKNNTKYESIVVNLEKLGKNLACLRKNNNMTQKEVASKLNITQSTISAYENGIILIKTTFLYNLIQIYNPFSIDKLFDRKIK